MGFEDITPQLQMNARFVAHDTGANADTTSTGGTLLYLSPGATLRVSKQMLTVFNLLRGGQHLWAQITRFKGS